MKKRILLVLAVSIIYTSGYNQINVKLRLPDNCYFTSNTHEAFDKVGELSKLKIIPNPTIGTFTLSLSQHEVLGHLSIKMYDSIGKVVYQEMVFSDSNNITTKIYLNAVLPGIYVLEVKSDKQTSTSKLVITQN